MRRFYPFWKLIYWIPHVIFENVYNVLSKRIQISWDSVKAVQKSLRIFTLRNKTQSRCRQKQECKHDKIQSGTEETSWMLHETKSIHWTHIFICSTSANVFIDSTPLNVTIFRYNDPRPYPIVKSRIWCTKASVVAFREKPFWYLYVSMRWKQCHEESTSVLFSKIFQLVVLTCIRVVTWPFRNVEFCARWKTLLRVLTT